MTPETWSWLALLVAWLLLLAAPEAVLWLWIHRARVADWCVRAALALVHAIARRLPEQRPSALFRRPDLPHDVLPPPSASCERAGSIGDFRRANGARS